MDIQSQDADPHDGPRLRRWHKNLTVQVLAAVAIGIATGHFAPDLGTSMQPLGDVFIKLIKMVVAPIVFVTVVSGIATVGDLKRVGRIGGTAILYFEVVTTASMAIGLLVADLVRPGDGLARAASGTPGFDASKYSGAGHFSADFFTNLVPDNVVGAFAKGDLLQIVLFSILFGCAATLVGDRAKPMLEILHSASSILFKLIAIIMRVAPIGAYGSIAFAVGKYGIGSVLLLGKVLACVYLTSALFVLVVLNAIAYASGFSLMRFLRFVGEEIMIVFGTATSESVLPQLIRKLNRLGCSAPAASLVLPTGYSFNADGASIYLSIATLFIAQAYGIDLSIGQQLGILLILMVTSKGAAGVGGAGFVTLAATLSSTHILPIEGMGLLIGVDRFMTEARAVTNIIGNCVATVVVSRMAGEFDEATADAVYAETFGNGSSFSNRPARTRM